MIRLLSQIIKIETLRVVGVYRGDDSDRYEVLTIKKKSGKIELLSKNSFGSFEAFLSNTDQKLPVLLVIDGKGILNKNVDFTNEPDANWYKNIDSKTIYQTAVNVDGAGFISFCRNTIVEEILAQFNQHRFQVADVYIGSFLTALLAPSLNQDKVLSNELSLEFKNGILCGFSKQSNANTVNYTLGTDNIPSTFLPLYGAMVHFFVGSEMVTKTDNALGNEDEIVYKKAFHILGIGMLAVFFISLLSSYLAIQYYSSENAALNLQSFYSNESYQKVLELEKQKQNKETILAESGFLSANFLSFYAYEITKSVPGDVMLNGINIMPVVKQYKASEKLKFEARTIIVSGETFNEASFSNWMEAIKAFDWVENFEIISLKKDKKNKAQFEVKITIKDV